jgi:glutaredoxin
VLVISIAAITGGCDRAHSGQVVAGGANAANDAKGDAPSLTGQIDQSRDKLGKLQVRITHDAAALASQYKTLAQRRKGLLPGDEASIAAFNREAAAYEALNARLGQEKAEADACDRSISALLSARAKLNPAAKPVDLPPAATPPPAVAAQPSSGGKADVVIYSTSWCGYCKIAKAHFAEKGVSYEDIDIEKSADGAAKYKALGGGGVPIIVIKGQVIHGYDQRRIDALL